MKLLHKGIVLVLVPVAFEFVFVGSLFYMLDQSELEVSRAKKACEIAGHLNQIQRLLMIMTGGLPVYIEDQEMRGPARNSLMKRRIDDEFKKLRECVKNDPELTSYTDRMENSLAQSMFITADIKNLWNLLDKAKSHSVTRKGGGLLDGLLAETDIMMSQTEKIEKESPLRQAENRERIKGLLLFGLGVNIFMAVALAFHFNRGTVSRLALVMDNTQRLAEGREFNAPLQGNDEIADLDRTFSKMAKSLEVLAQNERALLANAADVICSLDVGGTIADVSPACEKIWGYNVEEILSMRLMNLVFPEDSDSTSQHIAACRAANTDVTFENRIKRKDGSVVDMLWSVKWSPEEKTFFCVAHDNTDRKNAERMKQDFVAMLSHDLRSPLNSVQAFFTMVSDKVYGSLNEKGMARAASLESTVSWLIEMISDLLDIDKIEAGLADLDLKVVSLRKIAMKADKALESFAESECVSIELPKEDANVLVDEDMFMRVVTNLLSNAVKFSPKNSEVKVEIEKFAGFVELRIIDRGKGIAPEDQEVIFERFRQVRGTDGGQKRSSGLGLAVAKAIVEQHRGTLGVRSAAAEGSTFWVRLPEVEQMQGDVSK